MKYKAIYNDMQNAVSLFYDTAKTMDKYVGRLDDVKNQLGLFTSLAGYKSSVGSRATAVGSLAVNAVAAGQCLDNARIEYLLSEQTTYQMISGDTSFNVGDGVTAVGVPDLKGGEEKKPWWQQTWDGLVNVGKNAVKAITETYAVFKENISPGGKWYKAWEIGKAAVSIAVGVVTVCTTPVGWFAGVGIAVNVVNNAWHIYNVKVSDGNTAVEPPDVLKTILQPVIGEPLADIAVTAFDVAQLALNIDSLVKGYDSISASDVKSIYNYFSDIGDVPINTGIIQSIKSISALYPLEAGSVKWFNDLYDTYKTAKSITSRYIN